MRMIDRSFETDLDGARKPAPTFAGRLYAAAMRTVRAWQNRKSIRRLEELDDRQLLDMGLRRSDIRQVMTASFSVEPGLHLTIAARERARRHLRCGRLD